MQISEILQSNQVFWPLDTPGDRIAAIQTAVEEVQRLLKEYYSNHQNRLIDPLIAQLDASSLNGCKSHAEINDFLYKEGMYTSSFLTIFQETLQHLFHLEMIPENFISNNLMEELINLKKTIFDRIPASETPPRSEHILACERILAKL